MPDNKIFSYVGFALKAGKVLFGVDSLETTKKKVFLVLYDETLAENSWKRLEKAKENFSCAALPLKEGELERMVHRENTKCISLQEKALAEAILKEYQKENTYPWEGRK